MRRAARTRIGGPIALSALMHAGILAAVAFLARPEPPLVLPPVYRVQLFAAPPGPRQIGVVQPPAASAPEAAPAPAPATPPPAPEVQERAMPMPSTPVPPPRRPQQQATPNTAPTRTQPSAGTTRPDVDTKAGETKAAEKSDAPPTTRPQPRAPTAGGGPQGGRGTDVANVNTPGVDFPYPAYLNNIVRQIAVRFTPEPGSAYTAQVRFTIRRDGSVAGITVVRGSGDYEFDTEARAAVEAAGRSGEFGPLPAGFRDDALTVYFAFDPKVIR